MAAPQGFCPAACTPLRHKINNIIQFYYIDYLCQNKEQAQTFLPCKENPGRKPHPKQQKKHSSSAEFCFSPHRDAAARCTQMAKKAKKHCTGTANAIYLFHIIGYLYKMLWIL
ncbi:MAG: hypothetical protein PUH36_09000 [Subdoligranulum sp.]|nr:hypothetical protein [Subdoligranulum sp.]